MSAPLRECRRCTTEAGRPVLKAESEFQPSLPGVHRRNCRACENALRRLRRKNQAPAVPTMKSVFAFGDIHAPWHHEPALNWALELLAKDKPEHVVQVGDLFDMFSFSRHPRNPNYITPGAELDAGRKVAEDFWKAVQSAAPKAKCYQLIGNHDDRPYKKALLQAPELVSLIGPAVKNLFAFPNVRIVNESNEELVIDGVVFMHGFRSRLGDHMSFNQRNTVCGHSHRGGTHFERQLGGVMWELNAGFLGNINAPVFRYRAQARIHKTTLGIGIIDERGPRFVPYPEKP